MPNRLLPMFTKLTAPLYCLWLIAAPQIASAQPEDWVFIYIYIYSYIHVHIYVHVYMPHEPPHEPPTSHPRTIEPPPRKWADLPSFQLRAIRRDGSLSFRKFNGILMNFMVFLIFFTFCLDFQWFSLFFIFYLLFGIFFVWFITFYMCSLKMYHLLNFQVDR